MILTAIPQEGSPRYNVRALVDYCKEHGIPTSDVTQELMDKFLIPSNDK